MAELLFLVIIIAAAIALAPIILPLLGWVIVLALAAAVIAVPFYLLGALVTWIRRKLGHGTG